MDPDSTKPSNELLRQFFATSMESAADSCRPDIEGLCRKLGFKVSDFNGSRYSFINAVVKDPGPNPITQCLPPGIEFTFSSNGKQHIIVNDKLSSKDRNLVIAHAIGHYLDPSDRDPVSLSSLETQIGPSEQMANSFAAAMIAPFPLFEFESAESDFAQVAETFNIDLELVLSRALNMSDRPAIALLAYNDISY
jgi:hypothetical protein